MATWDQTRAALHGAVVAASQLPASAVYWKGQNVNQPALDCVAMQLGGLAGVGQDAILESVDLGRPEGEEVEQRLVGERETTLELEVFTAVVAGGGASPVSKPADLAMMLGEKIRNRLELPSNRRALAAVGVVAFDSDPVRNLPGVVRVGFRGRALVSIRCRMPAQAVAEYTGYIAKIRAQLDKGTPPITTFEAP